MKLKIKNKLKYVAWEWLCSFILDSPWSWHNDGLKGPKAKRRAKTVQTTETLSSTLRLSRRQGGQAWNDKEYKPCISYVKNIERDNLQPFCNSPWSC